MAQGDNILIAVPEKEYEQLLKDSFWLSCLQQAGVDNWSGIDHAFKIKRESLGLTEEDDLSEY